MTNNNNNAMHTSTSTQIRNMYSEEISYMNIKFFNTNLAFQLYPYNGKDQNGRSRYDMKKGQQTTVNYEGAYALYQASKDIIDGKIQELNMSIPCTNATLTLERKFGTNGQMETIFSINKNNVTIPFKFQTITQQIRENGVVSTKTVETGLGSFMMTIKGYLTGINADRHLDKLTEDYIKLQQESQKQPNNNQNGNGYKQNNYKKQNYGNNYQQPQPNAWGSSQNMSSYNLPN